MRAQETLEFRRIHRFNGMVQVHPTRASVDLAIAAMFALLTGVTLQLAHVVAFGGSLMVGLAIARAVTRLGIARIRAAGFEMLWRGQARQVTTSRGDVVELEAEIRNRDTRAARYAELRAVASPHLEVSVDPPSGEVPALGRLAVTVSVKTPRVGHHGIFGLSLEVQGAPGLFEVPLTFANPFGIEVMPRSFGISLRSAKGGRSRQLARSGHPGPSSGDGTDLREIRELRAGDAFKRIAWKASARRGKLMVRDFEREERDVIWLLLDASVELWAGRTGETPLDHGVDEVAATARYFLGQGDNVGLGIVATRRLCWLPAARGPGQLEKIYRSLALCTSTLDADRSDWDEQDVAARALEHMRPLDPEGTSQLRSRDVDRIARRADRLRARAPFTRVDLFARSSRDHSLRRYLAAYGVPSPARLEPERKHTDLTLIGALNQLSTEKPRASLIYVWSDPPDSALRPDLLTALAKQKQKRVGLRWISMRHQKSFLSEAGEVASLAAEAVRLRAEFGQERGERELRRIGVRVERFSAQPSGHEAFEGGTSDPA